MFFLLLQQSPQIPSLSLLNSSTIPHFFWWPPIFPLSALKQREVASPQQHRAHPNFHFSAIFSLITHLWDLTFHISIGKDILGYCYNNSLNIHKNNIGLPQYIHIENRLLGGYWRCSNSFGYPNYVARIHVLFCCSTLLLMRSPTSMRLTLISCLCMMK